MAKNLNLFTKYYGCIIDLTDNNATRKDPKYIYLNKIN